MLLCWREKMAKGAYKSLAKRRGTYRARSPAAIDAEPFDSRLAANGTEPAVDMRYHSASFA